MGGAPLTATAAQLSTARARSRTQARILAQGTENGLPILVESSGMVASWAGDQAVWVMNAQTQQDIPETSGTITPSGNLPISNPAFAPLSCIGSVSAVCIAHPLGWEFGTSSANGKPVGKQTITVAFADGTISSSHAYIYDGWTIACNAGFAYVGGVPVAQATKATSDVYADCTNNNLVFPMGAVLYSQPVQDQFGLTQTIMPTITAAIAFVVSNVNYPMPSTIGGQVYGIATRDGGFAKIYLTAGAGQGLLSSASGMSLHANVDGTYPF
jgi:hypothetical protein